MSIFKRKETREEMLDRIFKLTDGKDYGLFPPPMNAQVAVNELCRYLLGDDWYTIITNNEQANIEIVYEIERKYRRKK